MGVGIRLGLLETAVTVSGWLAPPPAPIPDRLTELAAASSVTVTPAMAASVGGIFAAFTVSEKLALSVTPPALTVKVMSALPVRPGSGVIRAVRLLPVPLKVMFTAGTKLGLEELAVTVRLVSAFVPAETRKPTDFGVFTTVV